jgi:aminoglycoside phosphotransferase (APT) family kinase protein
MMEGIEHTRWEQVLDIIASGARMTGVTRLADGTTNDVVRLAYETPSGRAGTVIARRRCGAAAYRNGLSTMAYEFRLLSFLHAHGFPVPRPLALMAEPGDEERPILVSEFVAGTSSLAAAHIPAALDEAADLLARIHAVDVSAQELSFLVDRAFPVESPAAMANTAVLLHGDFWPGNLLWRDSRVAAVLDWEDAGVGSPLIDLAGTRLELWLAFGPEAAERFIQRYQAARPQVTLEYLAPFELQVASRARPLLPSWTSDPVRLRSMTAALDAFAANARRQI